MTDLTTTQGPWMVRPTMCVIANHLTIHTEDGTILATVAPKADQPNWADAAAMAAAPHAFEALIEISTELNTAKQINIERINNIISQVFEKLVAETDVDL
jgi:thiamine monophosphate kinase